MKSRHETKGVWSFYYLSLFHRVVNTLGCLFLGRIISGFSSKLESEYLRDLPPRESRFRLWIPQVTRSPSSSSFSNLTSTRALFPEVLPSSSFSSPGVSSASCLITTEPAATAESFSSFRQIFLSERLRRFLFLQKISRDNKNKESKF